MEKISILTVLILITAGQALAKTGAAKTGGVIPGLNGFLIASYFIFLTRGILWAMILKTRPVSRVYPYLSLSYPLILIVSLILFDETLSSGKIIGTLLILLGTAVMTPGNDTGEAV